LRRLESLIAPRDVKRAADYIEANLHESMTMADLIKASGVASRTLFMLFKNFRSISPYERAARV
jgi:AraC-like DNA-binding protein